MTHSDRDGSDGYRDARREFVDRVIERAHTGGNGEDCPICQHENLPYPFLCRGTTAPAGLPLHESADRDADNVPSDRVRAYAEAIRGLDLMDDRPDVALERMARAVMAVADREQAELRAENEMLRDALHGASVEVGRKVATIARVEALRDNFRASTHVPNVPEAAEMIDEALRSPEPTEECIDDSDICEDCGTRHACLCTDPEPTDAP